LTFQSLESFGKSYCFSGTLKSKEIVGEIQIVDVKSGKLGGKWQVTATQVPPPQSSALSSGVAVSPRRYSNTDYSSEGGDLTGVDIQFIPSNRGITGMIVFYESYWGEPTFTPLPFLRVEMSKGVIHFETKISKAVARYHILPTPTGALFNRDDVTHEKGEKDIVLKRGRPITISSH
jgi:hypothetical protein